MLQPVQALVASQAESLPFANAFRGWLASNPLDKQALRAAAALTGAPEGSIEPDYMCPRCCRSKGVPYRYGDINIDNPLEDARSLWAEDLSGPADAAEVREL